MPHRLRLCLGFAGLALAALSLPLAAQEGSPDADTVVATVDGTEITLGHMIALRARLPQQYAGTGDEALFGAVLDQLVQQAALAGQVETPPPAVELAVENERRALLANEALRGTAEQAVTEEALRAAYEEAYGAAATEYNAAHILVETEEEAQEIVSELEGGADFAAIARERSIGPSGPNGGDLGWFGSGTMVPAFEAAVAELEPGEVSAPVQTEFGWHVVKLNETREQEPPAFEAVRDELASRLQRRAIDAAIAEATAAAEVERKDVSGIDPSVLSNRDLID